VTQILHRKFARHDFAEGKVTSLTLIVNHVIRKKDENFQNLKFFCISREKNAKRLTDTLESSPQSDD
jgi:hypothetical protein